MMICEVSTARITGAGDVSSIGQRAGDVRSAALSAVNLTSLPVLKI